MTYSQSLKLLSMSLSADGDKYLLKPQYSPRNASVDIIAIQGLWANPEYTWTRNGVLWLRDLLPVDMPQACIMTFQPMNPSARRGSVYLRYLLKTWHWILLVLSISSITMPRLLPKLLLFTLVLMFPLWLAAFRESYRRLAHTPTTEILDQARKLLDCIRERRKSTKVQKPIIFIGHSFGGLVIKQALIMAMQDPGGEFLPELTTGILFIGTPHRGARLATVSKSWWFHSSSDIRAVLELNSKALSNLDAKFSEIPRVKNDDIIIISFYEKYATQYGVKFLPLFKIHAVDKESATFPNRPIIELEKNHSSLVKFSSRDDPDYRHILAALEKIYHNTQIS